MSQRALTRSGEPVIVTEWSDGLTEDQVRTLEERLAVRRGRKAAEAESLFAAYAVALFKHLDPDPDPHATDGPEPPAPTRAE